MFQGQRRLAAIMFTDIVGYTALSQLKESLALELLEEHRQLVRQLFLRHGGKEVKTIGDAFLVEFASALEAVRCAFDIQQTMHETNATRPPDRRMLLRIGIHVGDVVFTAGDIHGDAVNIASRIEPTAEPGGICISEHVCDQIRNKFEFPLVTLGKQELKNVQIPIEIYKVVLPWEKMQELSGASLDRRRIAVLPLVSMLPESADEYFADGMTEELISTISNIGELSVISRTSAMKFKGGGRTVAEISRELRVGTLLEGSVRKSKDRIRITVQLIDAVDDKHLWAQSYDRELTDVFAVQSDVATNVADALKVRLLEREASQIRKKPTESIEAYTLYLKGRSLWNKRSKDGVLEALKLFEEAIKIDSTYARAYSGLADAYSIAASYDYMDRAEGLTKGREAATRALELDDALPEAHASLGFILLNDLAYHEAQRELQRAIKLNPSYASAHHWYSLCLLEFGNLNEAIEEIKKARELDPLSPVISQVLAVQIGYTGRLDEALSMLDKLLEREPTFAFGYASRADWFELKGMKDRAFSDLETFYKLGQDEEAYKVFLAFFYGWFNDREKALNLIQEVLQETQRTPKLPGLIADCYAVLGDRDECFSWADRAIGMKKFSVSFLRYSPFYAKVRNDPRFPEIFRKLGLPYNQASS